MMKPLRSFLAVLALALATLLPAGVQVEAAQVVRIGAVHFPPYVVRPENGQGQDLLAELVAALNRRQQAYTFVVVPASVTRRYRDLAQGRVDMVVFENPQWDWQGIAHVSVDMGLEDTEVFVARRVPGRQQDYFANLSDKHLALFSGYHYGFARYNADPGYLTSTFNATLTYSHESNLLMVARGRVDIAPVTRSFLNDAQVRHILAADQLLVSERVDQVYRHFALIRPGGAITAEAFSGLLREVRDSGEMARIFEPYGIRVVIEPRALPVEVPMGNKARVTVKP
ncbi:substrate-binding periplasmic protein [Pseudomonas ovata]|uniref:substrate-binding periplasmic protein n=1 Tax=Pseudomonas ovata TaxID=1839709 RepID=UPI000D69A0C7|nr:transporter substrate-binding domain-containing protein [Pseudomonas ovata]